MTTYIALSTTSSVAHLAKQLYSGLQQLSSPHLSITSPVCLFRWCWQVRRRSASIVRLPSSAAHLTSSPVAGAQQPPDPHGRSTDLPQRLLITLLTTVFYYYPSILTVALSLFQCYHIDPRSPQPSQLYPQNALVSFLYAI